MSLWKSWFSKKEEPKLTELQVLANSYKQIKPESLKKVFSSDNSILQISVCCNDIVEYTKVLSTLYDKLHEDKIIPSYLLPSNVSIVYLRDFYTVNNSFVDPIKTTKDFVTIVIKFLELYDLKEKSNNKTFELEKNLLITSIVVRNLGILIKDL